MMHKMMIHTYWNNQTCPTWYTIKPQLGKLRVRCTKVNTYNKQTLTVVGDRVQLLESTNRTYIPKCLILVQMWFFMFIWHPVIFYWSWQPNRIGESALHCYPHNHGHETSSSITERFTLTIRYNSTPISTDHLTCWLAHPISLTGTKFMPLMDGNGVVLY